MQVKQVEVGRSRQIYVEVGRCSQMQVEQVEVCRCMQMQVEVGRGRLMQVDVGRSRQMQVEVGRCRQIRCMQVDVDRGKWMQVDLSRYKQKQIMKMFSYSEQECSAILDFLNLPFFSLCIQSLIEARRERHEEGVQQGFFGMRDLPLFETGYREIGF